MAGHSPSERRSAAANGGVQRPQPTARLIAQRAQELGGRGGNLRRGDGRCVGGHRGDRTTWVCRRWLAITPAGWRGPGRPSTRRFR